MDRNPYNSEKIVIKYEELKADPLSHLDGFASSQRWIVRTTCSSQLRRRRSSPKSDFRNSRFGHDNPEWPKDKSFFRRGVVGSHKDEMAPDVLSAFLADASDTLQRYGYTV